MWFWYKYQNDSEYRNRNDWKHLVACTTFLINSQSVKGCDDTNKITFWVWNYMTVVMVVVAVTTLSIDTAMNVYAQNMTTPP